MSSWIQAQDRDCTGRRNDKVYFGFTALRPRPAVLMSAIGWTGMPKLEESWSVSWYRQTVVFFVAAVRGI